MEYLESLGLSIGVDGQPTKADPFSGEARDQLVGIESPGLDFNLIAYTTVDPSNLVPTDSGIMVERGSPFGDLVLNSDVPFGTPAEDGNSVPILYSTRPGGSMWNESAAIAPTAFMPSGPVADTVQGAIRTLTDMALRLLGQPTPGTAQALTTPRVAWGPILLIGGGIYLLSRRRRRG